ncbi:HPr family phosphocarrier protein [Nitrospirillum sp. BR 11828]|uniref:HPr family phosphocarrier protein n=1 Tax=Nitrospirillum sp. BR 11828 TaxID=3104325 RepID=UPI002ACAD712|nr:HPr family phosphocarrier protein [Nitrospirillum sp. BR 11828]MDZ5646888.1 HPr family phosphocarrier protein [Nitrospirillum sp. BR 11828]
MTGGGDGNAGDFGPARTALIQNRRGLHARAAAKFVKLAAEFDAEVEVERGDTQVNGQSIMGLMMLAAAIGTSITLRARGPQGEQALDALVALVDRKFDED